MTSLDQTVAIPAPLPPTPVESTRHVIADRGLPDRAFYHFRFAAEFFPSIGAVEDIDERDLPADPHDYDLFMRNKDNMTRYAVDTDGPAFCIIKHHGQYLPVTGFIPLSDTGTPALPAYLRDDMVHNVLTGDACVYMGYMTVAEARECEIYNKTSLERHVRLWGLAHEADDVTPPVPPAPAPV